MKNYRKIKILSSVSNVICVIILLNCLWLCSCEKLITGYGPQPSYFDTPEYEEKLNILGILRPDSLQEKAQSFIHVEKAISVFDMEDSLAIEDVEVAIIELENNLPIDSVQLVFSDFDGFYDTEEYRSRDFFPEANTTYLVRCKKEGFPELEGRTTIPLKPEIVTESIFYSNNKLSFTIKSDSLAFLYYIYVEVGGSIYHREILKQKNEIITIKLQLPENINVNSAKVSIIAYDSNMAEYINYNVNYKPNTYREDYSTVENGYGCLGSLNITEQEIYF